MNKDGLVLLALALVGCYLVCKKPSNLSGLEDVEDHEHGGLRKFLPPLPFEPITLDDGTILAQAEPTPIDVFVRGPADCRRYGARFVKGRIQRNGRRILNKCVLPRHARQPASYLPPGALRDSI